MLNGTCVLAVIPARGGSKRLKHKNTLMLDGRPLLAYSILAARHSRFIDEIAVTSDDMNILEVAKPYGARLVVRPESLAGDETKTIDTVAHALKVVEIATRKVYGVVILLQPNVPLRLPSDIDKALQLKEYNQATTVLTVDTVHPKFGHLNQEHMFIPNYPEGVRKQDVPVQLRENGVLYILERADVKVPRLFGSRVLPIPCRLEQSICNIDYQEDFDVAEAIYASEKFGYKTYFDGVDQKKC